MLTLTALRNVEYLLGQVAEGIEDYYLGAGEAPGVWWGKWADQLGLTGIVEGDDLRALINGQDPGDGTDWLAGLRKCTNLAWDAHFGPPKSVSLLVAFASPEVKARVVLAHVEAVTVALELLEAKGAVARQTSDGIRTRMPTDGFAVATFVHRTSRAGDPQLHTHCVIPNVARRPDGSHVALDGGQLFEWKRAVGCVYQEELRRRLTERLGVQWGPDRNGTREIVGFTKPQLRQFSKRTEDIEMKLAQLDVDPNDRAAWMQADDWASLLTRPDKDRTLTPERLQERWLAEAAEVGLPTGEALVATVCDRPRPQPVVEAEVVGRLLDPDEGLCAKRVRFSEAHVVEAIASYGAGQLDRDRILQLAADFLASEHAVRLADRAQETGRPRPPEWSTRAHLAMERRVLDHLEHLAATTMPGVPAEVIERAVRAESVELGDDQRDAVRALCGPGPALRGVTAPPGYGKTLMCHATATAHTTAGRHVLGVATTNQAVNQLRDVGVAAMTIARLRIELSTRPLAGNTTLIIDETSQVATRELLAVLDAVAEVPGVQVWCVGDGKQTKAVKACGLAAELERLTRDGRLPPVVLTENRRQLHAAERDALAVYRTGAIAASQKIRTDHGWEHDCGTPAATRHAMAQAVVADGDHHGPMRVAALAVTHNDCEDLADRIRTIRHARGELTGPSLTGPGWGLHDRHYAAGDVVLLHRRFRAPHGWVHNGTVLTVTAVTDTGLAVSGSGGHGFVVPRAFVESRTRGGPNVSHGWARTVDGSQGGTWTQVHLLGSAALNRYSGLVGQSRSRLPTHTWNVTRLADLDHGGALADDREAAEEVLDALRREPDVAFAIHHDPYDLDQRLTAERQQHLYVLAARPADTSEDRWERLHGWRRRCIDEIDTTLARHWADAVVTVARQGDPLAYGLDRLRAARYDTGRQREMLIATIPPDRTQALQQAERDLARRHEVLRYTRRQADIAQARLETGRPRRFGRPDRNAPAAAHDAAAESSEAARRAELQVRASERTVKRERHAVAERNTIVELTKDSQRRLTDELRLLTDSLDHARHHRIQAAIHGQPEGDHLRALLGPPPRHTAALEVWQTVADIIESHHDNRLATAVGTDHQTEIDHLIERLPELIAQAQQPAPTGSYALDAYDRHLGQAARTVDQDIGHGLEL